MICPHCCKVIDEPGISALLFIKGEPVQVLSVSEHPKSKDGDEITGVWDRENKELLSFQGVPYVDVVEISDR